MRKRKFYVFILSALLFAGGGVQAKQRTLGEARVIAERQAESLGITVDAKYMARTKAFSLVDTCGVASAYYVFLNGADKGFTIVSGDDRLPAIVGYSDHGTLSKDKMPEALAAFLDMYSDMAKDVVAGDKSANAAVAEAEALRQTKTFKTVAPLLGNIKWTQDKPFNDLCPIYDGTNHSAVGCVATAMAQVMAYWKYPKALCADIPAYVTKSYEIHVDGIKKGETYDWDNMLDNYNGDYTSEQAAAVAKLSYHCGVAVTMDYGYSSGSNVYAPIFVKYFGYDPDLATDLVRDLFTLDEWTSIIDRELEAGRPIVYGGQSSGGGHQFVCDGSDGNGLYHINWGWGGYQNGYFDITILNPKKGGTGSGTSPDGYNSECDMIVGLCPDNGKVDEPLVSSPAIVVRAWRDGDHSVSIDNDTRDGVDGSFRVTMVERMNNYSFSDFTGYYALGVKNSDGTYTPISAIKNRTLEANTGYSIYGYRSSFTFDYAFPVGTTTVYAIFSNDGKNWKRCGYYSSSSRPVRFTATETKLQENTGSPLSAKIEAEEDLIVGTQNRFGITLSNSSDEEFLGAVNVYTSSSASERPDDPSTTIYATVPAHSSVKRNVYLKPGDTSFYVSMTDSQCDSEILGATHFTAVVEDAPSVSLVSAESNAEEEVYELNDSYYGVNRVMAPRIAEDKAVFTYGLKNTGGTTTLSYVMLVQTGNGSTKHYLDDDVRVPGGGKVTYIKQVVNPSEVGDRTIICGLFVQGADGQYAAPSTTLPNRKLRLVEQPTLAYSMTPNVMLVYVAGEPTGVGAVEAEGGFAVNGGNGELLLKLEGTEPLTVYAIDGSKVAVVQPVAGSVQHIALRAGVYVVNGRKVVVR